LSGPQGIDCDRALSWLTVKPWRDGGGCPSEDHVGYAIDSFFNNGGTLPPAFLALFGLTGPALHTAQDQLSGEAATGAQTAAFQLGSQFLNVMLDPFVDGRCGTTGTDHPPLGYPPGRRCAGMRRSY